MSLQRGMNYRVGNCTHSIILMSIRKNAPYKDRIEDNGTTVIYEGHDVPRTQDNPNPKMIDQPENTPNGQLTENGKFFKAAQDLEKGLRPPERVRIYEKIKQGIWSYNGIFHLVGAWRDKSEGRVIFKFRLTAVEEEEGSIQPLFDSPKTRRIIPTQVKLEVWKRDGGKCVVCGTTDNLHFDHIIPFSRGGASTTSANIQLLCGRHNLQKHNKIE